MKNSAIIMPTAALGSVSRQTNLGVHAYDLDQQYSPDTGIWKSTVLDLCSPKYQPPAGYWFDRSRYNYHGTITGAVWKQLPSGVWVLQFDGIDDFVALPSGDNALNITGDLTVLMWVRTTSTGKYLACLGDSATLATGYFLGIDVGSLSAGRLSAVMGGASYRVGNTAINDNKWHLVGMSLAGTAYTIWLDRAADKTGSDAAPVSYAGVRAIGANKDGSARFFAGQVASLRVIARAFTLAEWQSVYDREAWAYR